MTVQFYEKLIYNGQKYKFYKHMNENKWKLSGKHRRSCFLVISLFSNQSFVTPLFYSILSKLLEFDYRGLKVLNRVLLPIKGMKMKKLIVNNNN